MNMRINTVVQLMWIRTKSNAYIMSGLVFPFVVTLISTIKYQFSNDMIMILNNKMILKSFEVICF